jgi:hypothetical protein
MHEWKSDATATPWFRTDHGSGLGRPAFVELFGDGTVGAQGEPLISANELPTVPTPMTLRLHVDRAPLVAPGMIALGFSANRHGGIPFGGGVLHVGAAWWLPITTDAAGHASYAIGDVPSNPQLVGLELYAQGAVDDPLGPAGDMALTRAIELRLGE